jgi:hypothetical protein
MLILVDLLYHSVIELQLDASVGPVVSAALRDATVRAGIDAEELLVRSPLGSS